MHVRRSSLDASEGNFRRQLTVAELDREAVGELATSLGNAGQPRPWQQFSGRDHGREAIGRKGNPGSLR